MKTLLCALLLITAPASAHSFYSLLCCSDKDCGPLPDGRFHGCFRAGKADGELLCLYVPGFGS